MKAVWIGAFTILFFLDSFSQETAPEQPTKLPSKFLDKLENRIGNLDHELQKKTKKLLTDLERQERKLCRKLKAKDSIAASKLFDASLKNYENLRQQLKNGEFPGVAKQYIPYLDSLGTSLKFLSANSELIKGSEAQLKNATDLIKEFEQRAQSALSLKTLIKERRDFLKNELEKFGLVKELKKYNKKFYYYTEQLKEYKEILSNPEKLERTTLTLLQKLPAFKKFWQEHSQLAALFPPPDNYGTAQALSGLQTRAVVQANIQQQIQAGGPNTEAVIQQNIQAAHSQLKQWKEKLNKIGGMNSDEEIPDFKVNQERTKKFFSRLEYQFNIQNTRSNSFVPVCTDLGLSVGFKINSDAVVSIGGSYKIGWGKDIRQISITHEGVGIRSNFEYRIKGNFFASGGYEQNYLERFDNIRQLPSPDYWQQSGLIGISKKYSINKKFKGDIKLFYDFLYRSHSPASQALLMRFGYGF